MGLDKSEMIAHIEGEIKTRIRQMKIKESLSFMERCNNVDFNAEEEMSDVRVTQRALKMAEDLALDLVKQFI